jgi:4-amino-4-deoxy-L-arabinose transferase-like glycosyltransferase
MTHSSEQSNDATPLGWRELALVTGVLLFGAVLRVWGFSQMGLCHFDEGVYAISGSWTQPPGKEFPLYPRQVLFAPPLYFLLIGVVAGGLRIAADQAAFAVSIAMGVATTALAWWVTRRWFGRGAALIVTVLLSASEYHIAFSRVALTDVTFGFFFLLALVLIAEAFARANLAWAALAGLASGLAWNTKYHGWLPIAVAFAVLVWFAWRRRGESLAGKRLILCWSVVAVVALACYLPWLFYVQFFQGGYFALARYQRTFFSLHWLQDLQAQVLMQGFFDGWLSRLSPFLAAVLAIAVNRGQWREKGKLLALALVATLAAGVALSGAGTALVATLVAVPILSQRNRYFPWLLLGSVGTLFVLTPFYKPYARLLIPFSLCLYIAAGVGVDWVLNAVAAASSTLGRRRWMLRLGSVAALCVALTLAVRIRPSPGTWAPSDGLHRAVEQLGLSLPRDSTVFVHGAPEVAYYLRSSTSRIVPIDLPIDDPQTTRKYNPGGDGHFLVTAVYSRREPKSRESLLRLTGNRLQPVASFPVRPNDVRLLDDLSVARARGYRANPTNEYDLQLYRILPERLAPR